MDSRKRGGVAVTAWVEAGRPADGLLVPMPDCDVYVDGHGQAAHWVHAPENCAGRPCTVHAPSNHHMRAFPTLFRFDRHLMERAYEHGVGHPDPDDLAWQLEVAPERAPGVHGCDGCCDPEGRDHFNERLATAEELAAAEDLSTEEFGTAREYEEGTVRREFRYCEAPRELFEYTVRGILDEGRVIAGGQRSAGEVRSKAASPGLLRRLLRGRR